MTKADPIRQVWIATGREGPLGTSSVQKRARSDTPSRDILKELEQLVTNAQSLANQGTTWRFDIAFRVDGEPLIYVIRPKELGNEYVATIPREEDAERKGWGHNPGLGILFPVHATDEVDAQGAGANDLFDRVLFWTFLSSAYCWPSKFLFSMRSGGSAAMVRLRKMALPAAAAKRFRFFSRMRKASLLRNAQRYWQNFQHKKGEERVRLLSALAAYRTGLYMKGRTYRTEAMAVVAFMAALEAIFHHPRRCSGLLTCDICGPLSTGHSLESHRQVILDGIRQRLGRKELEKSAKLMKDAYRAYRSGYVHSARTPLHEYQSSLQVQDYWNPNQFWHPSQSLLPYDVEGLVWRVLEYELGRP